MNSFISTKSRKNLEIWDLFTVEELLRLALEKVEGLALRVYVLRTGVQPLITVDVTHVDVSAA